MKTQHKALVLGPQEDWSEHPGKHLISDEAWQKIAAFLGLSDREHQVCRRLFEGLTREEIADGMDLKVRTIRHYLERLHDKLRVNNRVALVLRIIQVRDHLNLGPDSGDSDEDDGDAPVGV